MCFLLYVCFYACKLEENEKAKPNVLIILTDDQGWGDLSFTGNPNLKTPHIDRLGVEGISIDRFYVSPVCSPTRAEMLTGRYHLRGGVTGTSAGQERLDLDEITLLRCSKRKGMLREPLENGTMECNIPIIPMQGALKNFTVFVADIGAIILALH